MTSHTGRLYATALALVVFFLGWAAIAARPWVTTAKVDPRMQALVIRQAALQQQAKLVATIVAQRARAGAASRPPRKTCRQRSRSSTCRR